MRSGRLKYLVKLLRRTDTQLASGQVSHTYTEFAEVWASKSDITGREFFAAAQQQSEITTKFGIRWRDDVDATCQVRYTVRHGSPEIVEAYDVVSVAADEKTNRRDLVLMCKLNPLEGYRG